MSRVRLRREPDDLNARIGGIDALPLDEWEFVGGLYDTGGRFAIEPLLSSKLVL